MQYQVRDLIKNLKKSEDRLRDRPELYSKSLKNLQNWQRINRESKQTFERNNSHRMHWLDNLFVQESAAGTVTDGAPIAQSPEGVGKKRSNLNMKRKAEGVVDGDVDDPSHQSGEEMVEPIRGKRRYDAQETSNGAPNAQPSRPSKIIVLPVAKATLSPTVAQGLVGVDSQVVQLPEGADKQDDGAKKRGIDDIADGCENDASNAKRTRRNVKLAGDRASNKPAPPKVKRTRRNATKAGDMASDDAAALFEDAVTNLAIANTPLVQSDKERQTQVKKTKKRTARIPDSGPSAVAGEENLTKLSDILMIVGETGEIPGEDFIKSSPDKRASTLRNMFGAEHDTPNAGTEDGPNEPAQAPPVESGELPREHRQAKKGKRNSRKTGNGTGDIPATGPSSQPAVESATGATAPLVQVVRHTMQTRDRAKRRNANTIQA